jgi:hypothetical protein
MAGGIRHVDGVSDVVPTVRAPEAEHQKVVNLQEAGGQGHQFSSPFGFSQGEAPQPPSQPVAAPPMQFGATSSMNPGRGSMSGAPGGRSSIVVVAMDFQTAGPPEQAMNQAFGQMNSMLQQGFGQSSQQGQWQPLQQQQSQGWGNQQQHQQLQWSQPPQQCSQQPWSQPPQQWQQSQSAQAPPSWGQPPMSYNSGPPPSGYGGPPSGPQSIVCGWLSKRAEDWKQTYDTKWFALLPGAILTIAASEGAPEERRVQLAPTTQARPFDHPSSSGEAKVQRMKRKCGFEIFESPNAKSWLIDPGTEQKRNIWVQAINHEVWKLQGGGGGGPPGGGGGPPCGAPYSGAPYGGGGPPCGGGFSQGGYSQGGYNQGGYSQGGGAPFGSSPYPQY